MKTDITGMRLVVRAVASTGNMTMKLESPQLLVTGPGDAKTIEEFEDYWNIAGAPAWTYRVVGVFHPTSSMTAIYPTISEPASVIPPPDIVGFNPHGRVDSL